MQQPTWWYFFFYIFLYNIFCCKIYFLYNQKQTQNNCLNQLYSPVELVLCHPTNLLTPPLPLSKPHSKNNLLFLHVWPGYKITVGNFCTYKPMFYHDQMCTGKLVKVSMGSHPKKKSASFWTFSKHPCPLGCPKFVKLPAIQLLS